MTIVEFLTARLADPVGQGDPDLDCSGVGEYYRCDEWSEWHRRTVAAQRTIVELWEYRWQEANDATEQEMNAMYASQATGLGNAVRLIAAIYSDHPDYDPDWNL